MVVVKDLSDSFYPYPKDGVKMEDKRNRVDRSGNKVMRGSGAKGLKTDFCIMPESTKYGTKRSRKYSERHEVYFGRAYRNKSIKDGLIVFLTEEEHKGTYGVHGKKRG